MKFAFLISLITAVPTTTFDKGPTFEVTYNDAKKMLKYQVDVPENMYLALSYGSAATNVDMVTFQGEGDGTVTDYWVGASEPAVKDTQQDYKNTLVTSTNGAFKFVTYRSVDTNEATQDMVIKCDQSQAFKWAVNSLESAIGSTDKSGDWTLDLGLNSDCTTKTVITPTPQPDSTTQPKDTENKVEDPTPPTDTNKYQDEKSATTPKDSEVKKDEKNIETVKDEIQPKDVPSNKTPYEPFMNTNKPQAIAQGAPANGNWPTIDSTSNAMPFNVNLLPIGQKCTEASDCQTQCCEVYLPKNEGKQMTLEQQQLFGNPLNVSECRKASTESCTVEEQQYWFIIGSIIVAAILCVCAIYTHQKSFSEKKYIMGDSTIFPSKINQNLENSIEMNKV